MILLATLFLGSFAHAKPAAKKPLSVKQREARLEHAKELLGSRYKKSTVKNGESIKKINKLVYATVKERLPGAFQDKREKIAQTIIDEAYKYKFDPIFILSVIQSESSFRPHLLGSFTEIGLMQIKPTTAAWIAKKMNLKYKGDKDLFDPVKNIRIGSAFLSYLRDRFDSHAQLYLSAYNMGQGNVDQALEQNIWPKDYVGRVMKQYVEFYEAQGKKAPAKTMVAKADAREKKGKVTLASKSAPKKSTGAQSSIAKTEKAKPRDIPVPRVTEVAKIENQQVEEAIAVANQTEDVVQDDLAQDSVVQADNSDMNDPGLAPDLIESGTAFN